MMPEGCKAIYANQAEQSHGKLSLGKIKLDYLIFFTCVSEIDT